MNREDPKRITAPLTDETIRGLHAGDKVLINGVVYVARDAAHKRIVAALDSGEKPPFELEGQVVYYMGPSPARPGQVIGSAGPTTSGRMDSFAPRLLAEGLKGMIGKGSRSKAVRDAIQKHSGVYFAAVGGAGALLSKCIKQSEVIAYEELGAEAVLRIVVEDLPVFIVNDIYGQDLYELGREKYRA